MVVVNLHAKKPLAFDGFTVTFPQDKVVVVTLNRPEKLNCIDKPTSGQIAAVWDAFDQDDSLLVGIITGHGRAFCTGADLQEWNKMNETKTVNSMAAPGLAGLPRRSGKKPIIAAVNGLCMGGGFEMVANCDLVIASATAVFALPEVKRGIVPVAGCLPRLVRTLGLQRTTALALTGRRVDARTLEAWGLVSQVVDLDLDRDDDKHNKHDKSGSGGGTTAVVLAAALAWAAEIAANSPDAVVVARLGIRQAWEGGSVEAAVSDLAETWYPRLVAGPNFAEGIRAFVEKRAPVWVSSRL